LEKISQVQNRGETYVSVKTVQKPHVEYSSHHHQPVWLDFNCLQFLLCLVLVPAGSFVQLSSLKNVSLVLSTANVSASDAQRGNWQVAQPQVPTAVALQLYCTQNRPAELPETKDFCYACIRQYNWTEPLWRFLVHWIHCVPDELEVRVPNTNSLRSLEK
jgi:hypothetical protein